MKLILDNIITFLTAKVVLYSAVFIDMFPTIDGDSLMIRADPGRPVETRYMNESRAGQFDFSFYARSEDGKKAYEQLCDIQSALDLKMFPLTTLTLVSIEPTSGPSLVQKTEAGQYTYTAGFRLDYFSRR